MVEAWAGTSIGIARILNKIKRKGAVSKETAKYASELGLRNGDLKRLKRWVGETEDGRFYAKCDDGKHC
jgi:hypothetical protein